MPNAQATRNTTRLAAELPVRPFADATEVAVVLPHDEAALGDGGRERLTDFLTLIRREPAELEVELGAPIRFSDHDPGARPRFILGPAAANSSLANYGWPHSDAPAVSFDRNRELLVADAPDLDGIVEALNLLRTMVQTGADYIEPSTCDSCDSAITRIVAEVGWTYPAFALRSLDWRAICERHAGRVAAAGDPLLAMQEWLAELHDAHSWVRPMPWPSPLPYSLWLTPEEARFARVPQATAAWQAGVRPGDELVDQDLAGWWNRTGAAAHARPLVAGRRLLSAPFGVESTFSVRKTSGEVLMWSETAAGKLPFPLVSWSRLHSGSGYLRIGAWRTDGDVDGAIDQAFRDLADCRHLIVDLRANPGGNLNLACSFRDRFLHRRTELGSIRFSTGEGGLAEPQILIGEPAAASRRWHGDVVFLTDPLTYSASEDALLGLQGLSHVRVAGEPSGGGSGRMRTVQLLPEMVLTVSTALTYDRAGNCIDGAGIPVDLPIAPDRFNPEAPDPVLLEADRSW